MILPSIPSTTVQKNKVYCIYHAEKEFYMKKLLHIAAVTGTLLVMSSVPAYAETGWVSNNGNYYYYDSEGAMCKGWTQINGIWYYFGPNYGAMQTGLLTIDNHLYFFNSEGAMTIGSARLPDGNTYTFNEQGMLVSTGGWQFINGSYYYFDSSTTVVTGWKNVDGYYVNSDGERMEGILARGIDVSRYQNQINWSAVAQDDVEFAIIRVGSVKYGVDARYHENMQGANANGIKTGIYVYSYASTPEEAKAEAEFVLSNIQNYQISFPIAYDIEDSIQKNLSAQEKSALIQAFCSTIEEYGYHPIVYSSKSWFTERIDTSLISNYDKWVAQYYTVCEYPNPSIWQASSKGSISGISGNVDIDFQYKDYSSTFVENGWVSRAGNWFFFKDYRKQTGWVTDGGSYYFLNDKGAMQTGWHQEADDWFYLNTNGAMQIGWGDVSEERYFFNSKGIMQTGWTEINGNDYYFDASGAMQTGWFLDDGNYYYFSDSDGAMATHWLALDDDWYYMGDNGVMQTGFLSIDHSTYYMTPDGTMLTGWARINNSRYYFHENGQMAQGFTTLTKDTYYFDEQGTLTTGWNELNGHWYYFDGNGVMQTGFLIFDTTTFYFDENGVMASGWVQLDNIWYYFDKENGHMTTGWLELDDGWYYFDAEGKMISDQTLTLDGTEYPFDSDGRWMVPEISAETTVIG